jgi:hypothetical protein
MSDSAAQGMAEGGLPASALPEVGRRLVETAADHGFVIRLLGGAAIWLRATEEARRLLGRTYPDLDFVAHKKESRALRAFLEENGFVADRRFNAMHGETRLLYHQDDAGYQIDIFLDEFRMSHQLELGDVLEREEQTLPAAELLLTKLQIAEVNRKDITDVAMLLLSSSIDDHDGWGSLNVGRVARLCARDWGLYTTVSDNLGRVLELLPEALPDAALRGAVEQRVRELLARLEAEPKTLAWKIRARVGRRVRWYDTPEEVIR